MCLHHISTHKFNFQYLEWISLRTVAVRSFIYFFCILYFSIIFAEVMFHYRSDFSSFLIASCPTDGDSCPAGTFSVSSNRKAQIQTLLTCKNISSAYDERNIFQNPIEALCEIYTVYRNLEKMIPKLILTSGLLSSVIDLPWSIFFFKTALNAYWNLVIRPKIIFPSRKTSSVARHWNYSNTKTALWHCRTHPSSDSFKNSSFSGAELSENFIIISRLKYEALKNMLHPSLPAPERFWWENKSLRVMFQNLLW